MPTDILRTRSDASTEKISQGLALALTLATQAYVLERGRLVFEGPSEALRDDPSILHAAYLAARPAPASS